MSFPSVPDTDWKYKISLSKVVVVPLNQASDFAAWHLALRRLVTACNMVDGLLYSVPANQLEAVNKRIHILESAPQVKKEKEEKEKEPLSPSSSHSSSSKSTLSPVIIDLTEEKALPIGSLSEKELVLMKSLGVSKTQNDFFSIRQL